MYLTSEPQVQVCRLWMDVFCASRLTSTTSESDCLSISSNHIHYILHCTHLRIQWKNERQTIAFNWERVWERLRVAVARVVTQEIFSSPLFSLTHRGQVTTLQQTLPMVLNWCIMDMNHVTWYDVQRVTKQLRSLALFPSSVHPHSPNCPYQIALSRIVTCTQLV